MEKVQETDTKGESKVEELDIKTLFNPPVVEESADEKGEKDDTTPSPGESDEQDPKELKAQLSALTKELNRVRKGKTESSAEVREVREQLANLQGQLEVMSKGKSTEESADNRLAKYTDEQLLQGQTEWEDGVLEARDAKRKARVDSDEDAYTKANRAEVMAKSTLISIRKELLERTKRVGVEQAKAHTDANELVQEIAGLYETAYASLPDLKDKESALWKAGNEVYNRHPKLMKQLGPLAELVATTIALSEKPTLVPNTGGAKAKDARKELLTEINALSEKSLIKGKGTPSKKGTPNFDAMPTAQFDKLIHDLKMGTG